MPELKNGLSRLKMTIKAKVERIEALVTKTHSKAENIQVIQNMLKSMEEELHEINRKVSKLMEVVIGEEKK